MKTAARQNDSGAVPREGPGSAANCASYSIPASLPEKLWELLRRNKTFREHAQELAKANHSRQIEILGRKVPEFARRALEWMLPKNNILSAGIGAPVNCDMPWNATPKEFQAYFMGGVSDLAGLDAPQNLTLQVVDVAKWAAELTALQGLFAALGTGCAAFAADEKPRRKEIENRLFALWAVLSGLARRKTLLALPQTIFYAGHLEKCVLPELLKRLPHVPKRKSSAISKRSFLGTDTQWWYFLKLEHEHQQATKTYYLPGCKLGTVYKQAKAIGKLIPLVYPEWEVWLGLCLPSIEHE